MNPLLLLMGLLLVAYLGSFLVGGERSLRGIGLPSSVEWVVLGFIVGPYALGLVASSVVDSVRPIVLIGLGWLALVAGANYGVGPFGPVPGKRVVLAMIFGLTSGGLAGAAVYFLVPFFVGSLAEDDRRVLAITLGAAATETTRHVMRWVHERHGATGPLFRFVSDIADAQDVIPIAALAVAFSLAQPHGAVLGPAVSFGATLALGVVLGLVCSLLLGREFRLRESWGVLLGTSVLAIGVAARAQLSVVAVLFTLGMTLAVVSRHAGEIRAMLLATERSALLPILILCGIRLAAPKLAPTMSLVAIIVVVRILAKYMFGGVLGRALPEVRPAGGLAGLGMLSSGALTMLVGLSCALRFPGFIGDTVLVTAAVLNIVGELLGPPSLRIALRRAGELHELPPAPPSSGEIPAAEESSPNPPWADEEGPQPEEIP